MKLLLAGITLFFTSCVPYYKDVPVEDITAEKNDKIETIDLDTADVKVEETKEVTSAEAAETIKTAGAEIDRGEIRVKKTDSENKKPEVVKPLEIAKVDSKPANSLLADANSAMNAGDYTRAEALLQRALRIRPRDPKLWYKMSQIKYASGDYRQAAAMAMRSNTMTSNSGLKKQNWRIVANAREKLGDHAGAEQARRYASN